MINKYIYVYYFICDSNTLFRILSTCWYHGSTDIWTHANQQQRNRKVAEEALGHPEGLPKASLQIKDFRCPKTIKYWPQPLLVHSKASKGPQRLWAAICLPMLFLKTAAAEKGISADLCFQVITLISPATCEGCLATNLPNLNQRWCYFWKLRFYIQGLYRPSGSPQTTKLS